MPLRFVSLVLLAACGTGLQDAQFPTGSSTIVTTARGAVVNVNEDEGTVSWTNPDSGATVEMAVGERPVRLARVGTQLWVTLRGERAVAIVDVADDGSMSVVDKIDAGIEPFGIVSAEDGSRVYVASSRTGEVLEFDGATREVLRRFPIPDEPRWVALHPSGEALFVSSLFNGTVSRVDLDSGEPQTLQLPVTTRNTNRGEVVLTPRLTGDPAISPSGGEVAIPLLYVDNDTPVESGGEVDPTGKELPTDGGGYGSSGLGVSRLNPAVVTVDLGRQGDVTGEPRALFLATAPGAMRFEEVPDGADFGVVRGYPTSVTYSRDSYLITTESSSAIYAMRRAPFILDFDVDFGTSTDATFDGDPNREPFMPAGAAGFEEWPVLSLATEAGPRGVVLTDPQTAFVHTFLGRSVAEVDVLRVDSDVRELQSAFFFDRITSNVGPSTVVAEPVLTAEQDQGRFLFYSADDARMGGTGAGVSCSTCHFDSRNDGFTWTIDGRSFQTPSLAGPVSQTAPVTWADDVVSVAEEALLTTQLRMGGQGLTQEDADAIGAYVDTTPYPEGSREADDQLVQDGNRAFLAAGCAECHTGELYTDNQSHEIFPGMPTQTPTLRGVASSAPFLHDGSLATLDDVVAFAVEGRMGDASELTGDQRRALVAFLESL